MVTPISLSSDVKPTLSCSWQRGKSARRRQEGGGGTESFVLLSCQIVTALFVGFFGAWRCEDAAPETALGGGGGFKENKKERNGFVNYVELVIKRQSCCQ